MKYKSYPNRRPSSTPPRSGITLGVALVLAALSSAFGAPANSTQPASTQFEGSFDRLEAVSLDGWAWDRTQPNVPIKVDVYDGTKLLASVTAEGFRADLKSAGKGDGKHAFHYVLPQTLRDGRSHTISLRYAGTQSQLSSSPKALLFPKS